MNNKIGDAKWRHSLGGGEKKDSLLIDAKKHNTEFMFCK